MLNILILFVLVSALRLTASSFILVVADYINAELAKSYYKL